MGTSDDKTGGTTIFEVAEAAGVSITTVSHVFSGNRPVGERTRERVEAAARRLGYSPHRAARALASRRTMTLAVQFPYQGADVLFNPYFSQLVPAMSEAAVGRGYAFVLVPPNPPQEAFLRPLLDPPSIDGAILLDPVSGDVFAAALAGAGTPFVSLGRVPDAPRTPRVDQDFATALRDVMSHLRDRGYRRPALLSFPGEIGTLLDIREAFEDVAGDAAVEVGSDPSDAAAAEGVRRLLEGAAPPDVVVCISERQAAAVYRVASDLALRIPDDLGVVALGDSIATSMQPALTSVALFPDKAGRELVALIDRLIAGEQVPPLTLVPYALRSRASTARN